MNIRGNKNSFQCFERKLGKGPNDLRGARGPPTLKKHQEGNPGATDLSSSLGPWKNHGTSPLKTDEGAACEQSAWTDCANHACPMWLLSMTKLLNLWIRRTERMSLTSPLAYFSSLPQYSGILNIMVRVGGNQLASDYLENGVLRTEVMACTLPEGR